MPGEIDGKMASSKCDEWHEGNTEKTREEAMVGGRSNCSLKIKECENGKRQRLYG